MSSSAHPSSTLSFKTFETRWTAKDPIGLDKTIQDQWDEKRDQQVRTFETRTTEAAVTAFNDCLANAIKKVAALPKSEKSKTMVFVYGSYVRTDQTPTTEKWRDDKLVRNFEDKQSYAQLLAKRNKVTIVKTGIRTTGTIVFDDGSIEVVNPLTGFVTGNDDRKMVSIRPVETYYAVLVPN